MAQQNQNPGKFAHAQLPRIFAGLLLLAGLILVVSHIGELENFLAIVRRAEPSWLFLAIVLQTGTYACVAAIWHLALRAANARQSLPSLFPLGIAKLFSDQAIPIGGISGTAFFITALNRRGIPRELCMATLLLDIVSHYAAFMLAALATLLLLYFYHAIHTWIVIVAIVFSAVAAGMPAGALWLRTLSERRMPALLLRVPGLDNLLQAIADAPRGLVRDPGLILATTFLQGSIFVLDAATLWVMLRLLGESVSMLAVFPSFVLASMVATIGVIPMGLGTFEVSCVSMLHVMGVPVEAALTATLLLRGFTLWLPMVPGMWLARQALRS